MKLPKVETEGLIQLLVVSLKLMGNSLVPFKLKLFPILAIFAYWVWPFDIPTPIDDAIVTYYILQWFVKISPYREVFLAKYGVYPRAGENGSPTNEPDSNNRASDKNGDGNDPATLLLGNPDSLVEVNWRFVD